MPVERSIQSPGWRTCSAAGVIEDGTLIVRQGKIEAVGKDLKAPAGALVVDGKGLDFSGWRGNDCDGLRNRLDSGRRARGRAASRSAAPPPR